MKKLLVTLVVMGLFTGCLTGCNQTTSTAGNNGDLPASEDVVGDAGIEMVTQTCTLCEVEKQCGTYGVDGKDYVICDSCYPEFATGMQLFDPLVDNECSLCEEEKKCSIYAVKGEGYIVCDDCYNEFAEAFDLEKHEE